MLITGAILAACVKRFGLVDDCGWIGWRHYCSAAPGIILMSGNTAVGVALTVFFLLMYIAVFFFQPSYLLKTTSRRNGLSRLSIAGQRTALIGCVIHGYEGQTGRNAQTIVP